MEEPELSLTIFRGYPTVGQLYTQYPQQMAAFLKRNLYICTLEFNHDFDLSSKSNDSLSTQKASLRQKVRQSFTDQLNNHLETKNWGVKVPNDFLASMVESAIAKIPFQNRTRNDKHKYDLVDCGV
jgi:hypothetical protein